METRVRFFTEVGAWREPGINSFVTYIHFYLKKTCQLIR
jgi:hypothetical protein